MIKGATYVALRALNRLSVVITMAGSNQSKELQVDSTGQNVNSVIVNDSVQIHNEDIQRSLQIIIVILTLALLVKIIKWYDKLHKKRLTRATSVV